ncbi:cytochrome P450, partial [Amylostereum chailletii]
IPEQTQIIAHTYSIQRDSRNFSLPDAYLPERWIRPEKQSPKPEITVHNTAAFFPFSVGSTSCAGKNLAMLEMRMALCWLFQRFDMKFAAEGVEGDRWEESLEDYYIVHKGSMWVEMTPRC